MYELRFGWVAQAQLSAEDTGPGHLERCAGRVGPDADVSAGIKRAGSVERPRDAGCALRPDRALRALVTLNTLRAFGTLRTDWALITLRADRTLITLRTLRAFGTLRTRVALRSLWSLITIEREHRDRRGRDRLARHKRVVRTRAGGGAHVDLQPALLCAERAGAEIKQELEQALIDIERGGLECRADLRAA